MGDRRIRKKSGAASAARRALMRSCVLTAEAHLRAAQTSPHLITGINCSRLATISASLENLPVRSVGRGGSSRSVENALATPSTAVLRSQSAIVGVAVTAKS